MENPKRGHRLLVVDDDDTLRETVGRRMRRCGHFVVTAGSAEAALAHTELGREPYDVVITDVPLGSGMSGIELAAILLERHPAQRIVMVTGDSDEALARDAMARGPVSYLLKPFELFELEAAVNQALATSRYGKPVSASMDHASALPTIGTVPAEWLLWVDDHSFAGAGHADRVARGARVLALALKPPFSAVALAELEVAAWSHEIGLLAGATSNTVELAWRSADLLMECGSSESVIRTVRHMHERWDGNGGPDRLRGLEVPGSAQILAAADAIDHYCAAWEHTGIDADQAADRAISLVAAQQGTCFNPEVTMALQASREAVRSICGVVRRTPRTDRARLPVRALPFDVSPRVRAQAV